MPLAHVHDESERSSNVTKKLSLYFTIMLLTNATLLLGTIMACTSPASSLLKSAAGLTQCLGLALWYTLLVVG